MKIACLQFAPKVGELEKNIKRAEDVLARTSLSGLDLLVLPELALTGYNYPSYEAIRPYLEPTAAGISTQWAIKTAKRFNCSVIIGYPEVASATERPHTPPPLPALPRLDDKPVAPPPPPGNYNSTVTVSSAGTVIAHYRKSFLYYTDATWATPGSGFYQGTLLGNVKLAMGICMDINPQYFTAPWTAYEFANHVLRSESEVVVLSMAWLSHSLTQEDILGFASMRPDMETLGYWVERFRPVVEMESGREVLLVMANRAGVEGDVCYAGTSTVMKIGGGYIKLWELLGKGEERCLVVDIDEEPKTVFRMRSRAEDELDGL